MKRIITGAAIAWSAMVCAQAGDSTRYLIGQGVTVSGWGGFFAHWGGWSFDGALVSAVGGGGGVLLDRRFLVGGYGVGASSNNGGSIVVTEGREWIGRLSLGHGGAWLAYSIAQREPVHGFAGLQLGWGGASWTFEAGDNRGLEAAYGRERPKDISRPVLVITPGAGVELNVTRWFRPQVAVGYRFVAGADLPGLRGTDLNGFFSGVNVLFGGF